MEQRRYGMQGRIDKIAADDMTDAEPIGDEPEAVGGKHSPLRRCIATGAIRTKDGMIRFVVAPDGQVVADLEGRLPGRGFWITADRAAIVRAVARNAFAKAARRAVRVDPDLPDRLAALLTRRCLDRIGLARRAGQALAGFEKVREALQTGRIGRSGVPGLLLEATDGAADGKAKLRPLAGRLPVIELFSAADLGAALGRDHAVHAVVAQGNLASQLQEECRRLAGVRDEVPP